MIKITKFYAVKIPSQKILIKGFFISFVPNDHQYETHDQTSKVSKMRNTIPVSGLETTE